MQTLEAVNRLLEVIDEPPVSTLDTGGTSEAAEAETFLDRARKQILALGWSFNQDLRLEVNFPDVKLGYTGTTGTPVYGETVTQSGSGATGTFCYVEGGFMYLVGVSGTFAGTGTLTAPSGLSRTTTSYAAQTSGKIVAPSEWLSVFPAYNESIGFVPRDGFLYDTWESTFIFEDAVIVRVVTDRDFDTLHHSMAEYIVATGRIAFQRYKKRGQVDEAVLQSELRDAKSAAESDDVAHGQANVLDTMEASRMRGGRRPGRMGGNTDENYA